GGVAVSRRPWAKSRFPLPACAELTKQERRVHGWSLRPLASPHSYASEKCNWRFGCACLGAAAVVREVCCCRRGPKIHVRRRILTSPRKVRRTPEKCGKVCYRP